MVFWPSLPVDFLLSMYGVLTFFTCRLFCYLVYVDFLLSMYGLLVDNVVVFWPSLPSICRHPVVNVWCFDLLYLVYIDFLLSWCFDLLYVWCFDLLYLVYVDFLLSMFGVLTFFTCRLPVVNVWCFDLSLPPSIRRLPVVNAWCFVLLYL